MADLVSDIKARLSIEDVVSAYIPLKRAGRSFKALCPFHNEKTPSFVVNPEKQIAYCFGCRNGGDIFKFVQLIENTDFVDALKILADRAGLDMSQYRADYEKPKVSKSEKEVLINIHEAACDFFAKNLWDSEGGKKVLKYLKNRGLEETIIRHYKLGFALDSDDALIDYLIKKDFSKSAIIKSGLVSIKDVAAERISDKFKMRLMFPITDAQGKIIAFGGRALKEGQEPKYLNSPETDVYHKSSVLYGLSYAKNSIKEKNEAVVVEGYMDALMCFQAEVNNVVATSGTAMTTEHARMIKRFTQNLVLAFDNDDAGQEASKRAFITAQEQEMSVKALLIHDGKDPADSIKKDPEKFREALSGAKPFLEIFFDNLGLKFDLKRESDFRMFLRECMEVLSSIKNSIIQDIAVRNLGAKINVKESKIYDELGRYKDLSRAKIPQIKPEIIGESKSKKMSAQEMILGILLTYPELFVFTTDRISEDDFDEISKSLYKTFVDQYNNTRAENSSILHDITANLDSEEERSHAHFLSLYAESKYENSKPEEIKKDFDQLLKHIALQRINNKKENLRRMIKEAERKGDSLECRKLLEALQELCSK